MLINTLLLVNKWSKTQITSPQEDKTAFTPVEVQKGLASPHLTASSSLLVCDHRVQGNELLQDQSAVSKATEAPKSGWEAWAGCGYYFPHKGSIVSHWNMKIWRAKIFFFFPGTNAHSVQCNLKVMWEPEGASSSCSIFPSWNSPM